MARSGSVGSGMVDRLFCCRELVECGRRIGGSGGDGGAGVAAFAEFPNRSGQSFWMQLQFLCVCVCVCFFFFFF